MPSWSLTGWRVVLSAKPETTFYTSVHKHLPPLSILHREKMSNPYRGGTADHWYSGPKADLWIEWKFIKMPARLDTVIKIGLSELQKEWLKQRSRENRDVWVVVGWKEGGVVMAERTWEDTWYSSEFRLHLQTRQEIAVAIKEHCL